MLDLLKKWWSSLKNKGSAKHKFQKNSNVFLESILDNIPAMVFIKDAKDLRFVIFNKQGEEYLGIPGEELIGKTDYDFFPKDQADFFTGNDRKVLQSNTVLDIPEEPISLKHNGIRWLHTRKVPLFVNGIPEYLLAISVDVTDKKLATDQIRHFNEELVQRVKERTSELEEKNRILLSEIHKRTIAEKEAKESEERYKFLLNAVPQIIWTLDDEGNVDYINTNGKNYFGVEFEQVKGWEWVDFIHPDDYQNTIVLLKHSIQTGEPYKAEYRLKRKDGKYMWFLGRAVEMKDDRGKIIKWFGSSTDINEHKLALENVASAKKELQIVNEELKSQNIKLTKVNSDLDHFIYTASHDLKAPITNIEGLVNMLTDNLKLNHSEDNGAILKMMNTSIKRFQKTIRDLAEINIVQKDMQDDITEVQVTEAIEDVKLSIKNLITESDAIIQLNTSNIPKLRFSKDNFQNIVYNLLTNAIKFRYPGRQPVIEITTSQEGDFFVLQVKDNGIGIREDQKDKIFTMFKRMYTHAEGTGIGLYIVKRLVENSGGKIEVESVLDKGSVFNIFIKQ